MNFLNLNRKHIKTWFVVFFIVLAISTYILVSNNRKELSFDSSCVLETRAETVRGVSMSPLIADGEIVQALYGYYDCNPVSRGDIVLVRNPRNDGLLIKSVRAMPGDIFRMHMYTQNDWRVLVNNTELKNSMGESYSFTERASRMLLLYSEEFQGNLREGLYLIFGERKDGTIDSTVFGPIPKEDMLAKVVLK